VQELLQSTALPGAAPYVALLFGALFALVELGRRILGLLEAWDTYRANRAKR
jgi:hypothetical protein